MASQQLVVALAALVALCAFAAAADAAGAKGPPATTLPPNRRVIHPGKRNQVLTCDNPKDHTKPCNATCPNECPDECLVFCPGCHTFCMCEFYPGACGDPRFVGADGNKFYFHGKKDEDFCIVSDVDLHINAHFIGKRNPAMSRDFTWIQALGIRFADHQLYMGAQKTIKWDNSIDRLEMTFDGIPVEIPAGINGQWQSTEVPALTVTRTSTTNGVRVQLKGVFDIMAKVVPITEKDSQIHNYGVTEDDSLAHFDLGFKFHDLTDDVHGVLGQTYRTDYVNKLNVSAKMPLMGGAPTYVSSDIFATDCKVARFGRRPGISMVTSQAN
uniref:Uncharacterized protein n=1 Tax=Avena sativa TaxID=4498 RepID=A0ACD6ARV9_AVESA